MRPLPELRWLRSRALCVRIARTGRRDAGAIGGALTSNCTCMHVRQIDRSIRSYLPRTTAQTGRHIRELECKRLVFLNLGEACHGPKWMQLNLGGAEAYFAWRPAESLFSHTRTRLFSQLPILACARRSLKPPQPDFTELVASWFFKPFSQGWHLNHRWLGLPGSKISRQGRGFDPS